MQEYIFTDDDEEELRMYCEQARNSREQRQRTATEGLPASATTSQSTHRGGDSAGNVQRSYSSPPVQRTLCEFALTSLCYALAEDYPPVLERPFRRKDGPESGMSRVSESRMVSCARSGEVGQNEDAQDGADSSDGENSFETAADAR